MKSTLKDHKFIILCEDHANPLTLIRSLGQDGFEPIIVLVGKDPFLIPASKYAKCIHYFNTIEEGLDFIIKEYGHETNIPFLFSCGDNIESLFDKEYSRLYGKFYFFNGAESGIISNYMNKHTILEAAESCGLDVPKSALVYRGEIPEGLSYPLMTKAIVSTRGGWKNDVHICRNETELKKAYLDIVSDPVLIEEYIEKKNELCIDGVSLNSGEIIYMPFKVNYLRFTESAYGNYMSVSPFCDQELKNKIQALFRKTKFSGIFSIEFLITNDDKLKFLEINFRHSTWAIASKYGGANLPLIWARAQLDENPNIENIPIKKDSFTAMLELQDFNDHVRHGKLSICKWLKDFHECPVTFVYDKNDRKPFFAMWRHALISYIKKRI